MTPFIAGKLKLPSWSALSASETRIRDHFLSTPHDNAFAARQRQRMEAAGRERARWSAKAHGEMLP